MGNNTTTKRLTNKTQNMELYDLYHHCLNDSDKRYLAYLLKKEKVKATNELLIHDWVKTVNASTRLINVIRACYDNNVFPSQITKEMFLSKHNVGVSTWIEFEDLRGDNI
jgi:hypothetical protein